MEELIELLKGLEAGRFYGTLELRYEAGQITLAKKTETLKLGGNKAGQPGQQKTLRGA